MAAPMRIKNIGFSDNKISKKRKKLNDETVTMSNIHSTAKHKKKDSFTELEFKLLLRDSNTIFSGFEKFADECEKWPEESDHDLVAGYCRSSPECAEIFQVLEAGKRKVPELHLIFGCLEKILLRIADDLDKYHSVGQVIVNKLLATQIGSIFFTLKTTNKSSHIKTSLKLLVAMVMLGSSTAKSVLGRFDLASPSIKPLFNRRDTKDEEDVRTCLTHLVVAFLLSGDNEVIRKLASTKDCLANLFQGMVFDRVATVQLILSTVLEKVVNNLSVSKTTKVHIFTESSLKQIGLLYNWQGPAKWKESHGKGHKTEVEVDPNPSGEQMLLAETGHMFLCEVCTSVKFGIVFLDKTYGISGKNQNHTLTSFLSYLNTISQNALVQELIVKMLTAAPDQLRHFLPHLTHSLSPRPTDKWVKNMKFLYKVYEAQPGVPHVLRMKERRPTQQLVDILLVYTLPTPQVLNTFLPGVKNKACAVWYTSLQMVKLLAERAAAILAVLSDPGPDTILPAVYSADELADIIDTYRDTVLKKLPEGLAIFQCWDKAQELQNSQSDTTVKQLIELQELCGVSLEAPSVCIQQLLCVYQELVPTLLADHPVGLGKLLDALVSPRAGEPVLEPTQGPGGLSQLYLLKLLAGTDARRIPWGKESQSGHTLLYQLLGMVVRIRDKKLAAVSLQLLCKLLDSTGLFDDCLDELDIWFGQLQTCVQKSSDPSVLLSFVSKVFMLYMNNQFPYMSQVAEFVSEAVAMETPGGASSAKTIDVFIQEILTMDVGSFEDVTMETNNNDTCQQVQGDKSSQWTRYPFCPVLCTAMDELQKLDSVSPELHHYVSSVLLRLFHRQDNPRPFCLFVKSLDMATVMDGLQAFILSWLPGGKVPKKCSKKLLSLSDGGLSQLVRHHCGEHVLLDISTCLHTPHLLNAVKSCLLYVAYYISQPGSEEGKRKLAPILNNIVGVLGQSGDRGSMDVNGKDLSHGEDAKMTAEFMQLQVKQPGHTEEMTAAVEYLLNHEVMQQSFKAVFSRSSESDHAMCVLVVQALNKLFSIATENALDIVDSLGFYRRTLVDTLKLESSSNETSPVFEVLDDSTALASLMYLIPFLDTDQCVDVVEGVLDTLEYSVPVTLAEVILSLLNKIRTYKIDRILHMSDFCMNILLDYVENHVTDTDLADTVMKLFRLHPNLAGLCTKVSLSQMLDVAGSGTTELCRLLIIHNVGLRDHFGVLMTEYGYLKKANCMTYLPLVVTYVTLMDAKSATGACVVGLYKGRLRDLCREGVDPDPGTAENLVQLFTQLLRRRLLDDKTTRTLMSLLHQTFEDKSAIRCHHIHMIQAVLGCPATTDTVAPGDNTLRADLLLLCVQALGKCMELKGSRNIPVENLLLDLLPNFTQEHAYLPHPPELYVAKLSTQNNKKFYVSRAPQDTARVGGDEISTLGASFVSQADMWPPFVKSSLKYLYTDPRLLNFLVKLIKASDSSATAVTLETVMSMVMSHSSFLPVMFNEESPEAKGPLLNLLLELVERCPESCQHDHVGVLLGAYGATLSIVDQMILKLLLLYERNGISFTDFKPYLWGEKAVEHHSLLKSLGPSLLKEPRMGDVIANLRPHLVQRTILKFPLKRPIQPDVPVEASQYKSEASCYDPCFLLPLFSHLLAPGALVDCRKFVASDCLGLTIAALSSHDEQMRSAAYHVLDLYQAHLAGARFMEMEQIGYLLDCLRNSVSRAGNKLACIVTLFLARVTKLMLNPDDHMYGLVNTFLLLKPAMDVLNVPEFYKLFNSSDMEFKAERSWMLTLLLDGLRETADYRIYEKRYTFKLLQSFYESDLSDVGNQLKVLEIMTAACKEKSIAMDLWHEHGFIVWLSGVVQKLSPDMAQHVAEVIRTVSSLWFSVLGKKEYTREITSGKTRCLPPLFTGQMLAVIQSLLWYLRDIPGHTMKLFITTLQSIVQHVGHTTDSLQSSSMNPAIPSLTQCDVMLLLFHAERFVPSHMSTTSFLHVISTLGFNTAKLVQPKAKKYFKKPAFHQREVDDHTGALTETSEGAGRHDLSVSDDTSTMKRMDDVTKDTDVSVAGCAGNTGLLEPLVRIILQVSMANTQQRSSDGATAAMSSLGHCACLLVTVQWLLGRVHQLENLPVLSDIARWVQRNVGTDGDSGSNLVVVTLSESTDIADSIIHGLLQMYARLETLVSLGSEEYTNSGEGTCSEKASLDDSVHSGVSSVNSVLFDVAAHKLDLDVKTWPRFCESQKFETSPVAMLTEEEKSVILREHFSSKYITIPFQSTPSTVRDKQKSDTAALSTGRNKRRHSSQKTPSKKQKAS